MQYLRVDELTDLLGGIRSDGFHLEVADDHSQVADESEPMRRVLAGLPMFEPDAYPPSWQAWDDLVQAVTRRGARLRRARIITEPHSDYVRFLHATTDRNITLGEDIRWLPRHLLTPRDYTTDEWWLLDDVRVAFTLFDTAGDHVGAAVTSDPVIVDRCRRVRDLVWEKAIPHEVYVPGGTKGSNRRRRSSRRRFALADKMIDVFDYWLDLQKARVEKGEIVKRTYTNYSKGIKPAPKTARNRKPNAYKLEREYGGLTIGQACNRLDIVDYLDEVFEVAPNTAMLHHVILKSVWKMLMTNAPIESNPMDGIPQPKPGGYEPRALVGAEPAGILRAITRWLEYGYSPSEYLPCYYLLMLGTGVRPAEALAVRWCDILDLDEERAIIHICGTVVADPFHRQNKRKRGPGYYIVAPRWLTRILKAWKEFDQPASEEQAIFLPPYGDGDWLHPSTVQRSLETLRSDDFEWFTWTNLRDTVATVVAVETEDDDQASAQLGHTSALRRTIAQRHYIDPKGRPIKPVDNADALEVLGLEWTPTKYRRHRAWIDRRRETVGTTKVGAKLEKVVS